MRKATREDYLRALHELGRKGLGTQGMIRISDLADHLHISKPSASAMVRKLKAEGLIEQKHYGPLKLTAHGKRSASRITHNHRVIEVFLFDVLRYDKERIHEEAHKLEHAFSEDVIRRLDSFLKNPKVCPHGTRIHR